MPLPRGVTVLVPIVVLIPALIGGCAADREVPVAGASVSEPPPPEGVVPVPTPAPEPTPATTSGPAGPPARYVFPVDGKVGYAHNRHEGYPAADIIAGCGQRVRAVTAGVVLEVNRVDRFDRKANRGADRGGLHVSIRGDDGVRYYGSHFSSITKGLGPGDRVSAGTVLGRVGRTGHAGACHLHFGLSPVCARTTDWWVRRGVIWPGRFLDAWRAGERLSPAGETTKWQKAHGCPAKAPKGA